MSDTHKGHRQRLMNKVFNNGIETLYEHEFLELCLFFAYKQKDTNKLAHVLLDKFGNLDALCNATIDEIRSVEGIGPAAARTIKLIPHIAKGYSIHTSIKRKMVFSTRDDIAKRCVALLSGCTNELVYVLCFDERRHLIQEVKIAEGSPGCVNIDPRKVIDAVAYTSTSGIVLCHNHPSGILIPSNDDALSTQRIANLMHNINIEFIDHILVADGKWISCTHI